MASSVKVPSVGESITEVIVSKWLKQAGDQVKKDEALVTLETDKVNVDVVAEADGVLSKILKQEQDTARVGESIGEIEEGGQATAKPQAPPQASAKPAGGASERPSASAPAPAPGASSAASNAASSASRAAPAPAPAASGPSSDASPAAGGHVMPAAQRAMGQHGISREQVQGSGPGGRVLKEDVMQAVERGGSAPTSGTDRPASAGTQASPPPSSAPAGRGPAGGGAARTGPSVPPSAASRVVPMSPMRRRIAERLVQVQHTAAILTTFNEVDMSAVMELRRTHQDAFVRAHGVKLGFMSFFVKAAVDALRAYPEVNAEIRGHDMVYHDHYDVGVAVGSERGLVVPVLRRCELMGFAEVERAISDFGKRAQSGKISIDEMQGGTFTITNGGTYGSLMSTPIINPPQSGILGMHNIVERPIGVAGNVVLRPMMYIALSYDHRIVDGRGAVSFLKRIKQCIEEPARMLVEV